MIIYPSPDGKAVLAIPCDHPGAPDGVFYCIPSYFDAPHMHNDYGFILVDTRKVISELKKNNPAAMQHAEYKFSGETVEGWLKASFDHPRDMGFWTYGTLCGVHRPLAMN